MVLSKKRSQRGGRRCGMSVSRKSRKQRGGRRCGMVGSKKQRGGSKKQRGGRRCGMVGSKKQRGGYPNVYRVSTMRGGFGGCGSHGSPKPTLRGGYVYGSGSSVSGSPIEKRN